MKDFLKFDRLKYFCSMYLILLDFQFLAEEAAEEYKDQQNKCPFSKEDLLKEYDEFTKLNESEKEDYVLEFISYMYDEETCTISGFNKEDSCIDENNFLYCLTEIFEYM